MSREAIIKDYVERATPALAREISDAAVAEAVRLRADKLAEDVVGAYFESNREYLLDRMAVQIEAWLDTRLAKCMDEWLENDCRSLKETLDG